MSDDPRVSPESAGETPESLQKHARDLQERLLRLVPLVPRHLLPILEGSGAVAADHPEQEEPGRPESTVEGPEGQGPEGATDLERAAAHWGEAARFKVTVPVQGWLDSPVVLREVVQPRQTGERDTPWLHGLCRELSVRPDSRWLSLGCGGAATEISAARDGLFGSMLALDVSPAALDVARTRAAEAGVASIEFREVDLNRLDLPFGEFDVVLACMSLHHVRNLSRAFREIRRALRPGGFLLMNEYVGPRQFQFPDRQLEAVRSLLAGLPERLRIDWTTGRPKTEYVRMPVEVWNATDPSEAVRSDRILHELSKRFEIVVRRDYGGTLLHLALEHIAHNFLEEVPAHAEEIRELARIEDERIHAGDFGSDFTIVGARRPRSSYAARVLESLRRFARPPGAAPTGSSR